MIRQFFSFVYKGGRTYPWFSLYLLPKSTKSSTLKDENTELAETVAPSPVYFFQSGLKQKKELEPLSPALNPLMLTIDTSKERCEDVKSSGFHGDSPDSTEACL